MEVETGNQQQDGDQEQRQQGESEAMRKMLP